MVARARALSHLSISVINQNKKQNFKRGSMWLLARLSPFPRQEQWQVTFIKVVKLGSDECWEIVIHKYELFIVVKEYYGARQGQGHDDTGTEESRWGLGHIRICNLIFTAACYHSNCILVINNQYQESVSYHQITSNMRNIDWQTIIVNGQWLSLGTNRKRLVYGLVYGPDLRHLKENTLERKNYQENTTDSKQHNAVKYNKQLRVKLLDGGFGQFAFKRVDSIMLCGVQN